MNVKRRVRLMKVGVWLLGLYPLARAGWWILTDSLGAEPIQKVMDHAGWWTLTLLMVTLSVTPLRWLTGRNELVKLRRPLGLFAFFYGTLHLSVYISLDQFFEWQYIVEDIVERPFITVGFAAWLILLALAFTSTRGWIRRLGKRWTTLHRFVYLAAALGVIHFYWRVKADTRLPLIFAGVFLILMALRVWRSKKRRKPRRREVPDARDGAGRAGKAAPVVGRARAGAGAG